MEFDFGTFVLEIMISIVATVICYLTFPIIRLIIHRGKFERKRAHRIALWNSIIVGIFFFTITTFLGGGVWNAAPAFIYYWINRAILTKKETSVEIDPEETEPRSEMAVEADTTEEQ